MPDFGSNLHHVDQVCFAFFVLRFFFWPGLVTAGNTECELRQLEKNTFRIYCCHDAWAKKKQNAQRKTKNKLDWHSFICILSGTNDTTT